MTRNPLGKRGRWHRFVPAAALCLLWRAEAGTFDDWKWKGELKAPAGGFVALPLEPAVLDSCEKLDLSDLRIADPRGTEVPYAIVREKETQEEVELQGQVLNRENPSPETSRLTVDFGSAVLKNRITVTTSGDNFRRSARVEGSSDQTAWADLVKEGWLFAVGRGEGKRFETLDLGANTYRYIRVTVSKMPEEEKAPRIGEVTCRHVVVRKPEEKIVPARLLEYSTDPRTRASTALLDFGARHLPIARLRLTLASDPQRVFRRPCNIWGRNSLVHIEKIRFETDERGSPRVVETAWLHMASGVIFRDADGKESLELSLDAPYRYQKIVIENGDSPPLELGGVVGVAHPIYAVFEPAGQSRFTLYSGNPDASEPRYEAAGTLAALDLRGLPKAGEVALTELSGARKEEAPAGQTAVWAFMAIAAILTAALLWYTAVAAARKDGKPGRS